MGIGVKKQKNNTFYSKRGKLSFVLSARWVFESVIGISYNGFCNFVVEILAVQMKRDYLEAQRMAAAC